MSDTPWWQPYFSELYGKLYRGPLAGGRATALEARTLARVFAAARGPVLDAGCGFGRVARPLAAAGIDVVGADFSPALLAQAPKALKKRLVRADVRSLPFRDNCFGGAALLFNTFGYFAEEENRAVLGEIARVLRRGAPFVLDIPNREGMAEAVAQTPASIRQSGKTRITESWHVDEESRRLEGSAIWEHAGEREEQRLSIRLYSPQEIRLLLEEAGFAPRAQVLPFEEFASLGTPARGPRAGSNAWNAHACMAILARKR